MTARRRNLTVIFDNDNVLWQQITEYTECSLILLPNLSYYFCSLSSCTIDFSLSVGTLFSNPLVTFLSIILLPNVLYFDCLFWIFILAKIKFMLFGQMLSFYEYSNTQFILSWVNNFHIKTHSYLDLVPLNPCFFNQVLVSQSTSTA